MKGKEKADILAAKLSEAPVGIAHKPVITERLLLPHLDIGVTLEEIQTDFQW